MVEEVLHDNGAAADRLSEDEAECLKHNRVCSTASCTILRPLAQGSACTTQLFLSSALPGLEEGHACGDTGG